MNNQNQPQNQTGNGNENITNNNPLETIIDNEYDKCPIFLVDKSGSTDHTMTAHSIKIFKLFGQIIQNKLKQKNIEFCNLIYWSSSAFVVEEPVQVDTINENFKNMKTSDNFGGGTDLSCAFQALPLNWYNQKPVVDIFILTDGELNEDAHGLDGKITNLFQNNQKIRIFMITVEANNVNYKIGDHTAGTTIYKIFRDKKLLKYVHCFEAFNNFHTVESFISYSNPIIPSGYVPFRNQCFPITKTHQFIVYVSDLISEIVQNGTTDTGNDDINKDSDINLMRLAYDLSITIYNLIKTKPDKLRYQIIEIFRGLFNDVHNYVEITKCLTNEINNHQKGIASTFQEYREKRQKLFERAQSSLHENVLSNISVGAVQSEYISLPILTEANTASNGSNQILKYVIYRHKLGLHQLMNPDDFTKSIKLGNKIYHNAGIKIQDHVIPIFPKDVKSNVEFSNQCTRQWIRALYSKIYNLHASDDLILYLFLTNMFGVCLSDVSSEVKDCYTKLGYIMLDRRRYMSGGVKEIDHLKSGNPPKPNSDSIPIENILKTCIKLAHFKPIEPFTLWFGIILALNNGVPNKVLFQKQTPFCQQAVKDNFGIDISETFELDKIITCFQNCLNVDSYGVGHNLYVEVVDSHVDVQNDYEYFCYISLDDTTETGGSKIPAHHLGGKIVCNPKYVISPDVVNDFGQEIQCPICYTVVQTKTLEKIKPLADYKKLSKEKSKKVGGLGGLYGLDGFDGLDGLDTLDELNKSPDSLESIKLDARMFNTKKHEIIGGKNSEVSIEKITKNSEVIYEMDKLDFNSWSFELAVPYVSSKLDGNCMVVRNSTEFIEKVNERYPFIKEMDMENLCIAGGFCRSILLSQPVNDIDFFFTGIDDPVLLNQRLEKAVRNVMISLNKSYDDIYFLILYKENTSVYEILCFKNGGDKLVCKIQFILATNKSIGDLLNRFDLGPACVAYNGNQVYFNDRSFYSFKYMINTIDESTYTILYNWRLKKYFTCGFSVVMPDFDIKQVDLTKSRDLSVDTCIFKIDHIEGNNIVVNSFNLNAKMKMDKNDKSNQNMKKLDDAIDSDLLHPLYGEIIKKDEGHSNEKNETESEPSLKLKHIFAYIDKVNNEQTEDGLIYFRTIKNLDESMNNLLTSFDNKENGVVVKFVHTLNKRVSCDWYGKYRVVADIIEVDDDVDVVEVVADVANVVNVVDVPNVMGDIGNTNINNSCEEIDKKTEIDCPKILSNLEEFINDFDEVDDVNKENIARTSKIQQKMKNCDA